MVAAIAGRRYPSPARATTRRYPRDVALLPRPRTPAEPVGEAVALARDLLHRSLDLSIDAAVGSGRVARSTVRAARHRSVDAAHDLGARVVRGAQQARAASWGSARSPARGIGGTDGFSAVVGSWWGRGREAGWSVWSTDSRLSAGSIGSHQSILSAWSAFSMGSIASLGSAGSVASIGSVGSIGSIGSAGSVLSIGSAGSVLAIGGRNQRPTWLTGDLPADASVRDVKLAVVDRGATVLGALALAAALR